MSTHDVRAARGALQAILRLWGHSYDAALLERLVPDFENFVVDGQRMNERVGGHTEPQPIVSMED